MLLSFQIGQYPNGINYYTPWLYVGTNGYLYGGDVSPNGFFQVSTPISSGWHIAVIEEWAASTSGPYYASLFLDGKYIGQASTTGLPQLFGLPHFPYDDIGTGYTTYWPATPGGWFFFNGYIALVALYPFLLSSSQVASIGSGSGLNYLPPGYVALYIGFTYNSSSQVWVDASGYG